MRLPRFLFIAALSTCLCLLYVWQQTEVLRFAYVGQKNLNTFQDLLDKNSALRYNLKRNTSLIHIGSKILESRDYEMPGTYCLVKLDSLPEGAGVSNFHRPKKENFIARFFAVKRQAEAKTVNPFMPFTLGTTEE